MKVDALEAGGHDELASVLRNSVDFAKKMLANLAHMKFVMYDNLELEKSTDSDAAFTSEKYQNLRDQLVQQAQVSPNYHKCASGLRRQAEEVRSEVRR